MKSFFNMLFLGDYKANTGYGTVSKNLVPYWKQHFFRKLYGDKWHLDICAVNFFGDLAHEDKNTTVFSALKSMDFSTNREMKDDFGRLGFINALFHAADPQAENEKLHPSEIGYDGVFIIQDVPVITVIVPIMEELKRRFKKENKKDFKTIIYFPADFQLMPAFVKDLEFFDAIVTYNEYSRQAVLKWNPDLKKRIKVIPHGTNTTDFFPLSEPEILNFRKEYFGDNSEKFIVTNVNRNQPRKDFPTTIFGFEEYHKQNPDSFLYLHTNPNDPLGHDLRAVLMQTSLQEGIDFMLPEKAKQNHGFSVQELNLIYNASDVFLTTTLGEGHGLTVTEAMACGLPVICPLNTSMIEITDNGKRAYVLENQYPVCSHFDNAIRDACDLVEVSEKLAMVHEDLVRRDHNKQQGLKQVGRLQEKTERALQYVRSLTWDSIGERWVQLMKEVY